MLRTFLLGTAAATLVVGSALAADLPARVATPAPYVMPPVFTWNGFYIGVNAGAAWSGHDGCARAYNYNSGLTTPVTGYDPVCDNGNDNVGCVGGGQIGVNSQMGALVLGLEGDLDWMSRNSRRGYDYALYGAPYDAGDGYMGVDNDNFRFRGDLLATVRGRLGFALDRALFYVTGGAAFRGNDSDGRVSWTHTYIETAPNGTVTATDTTATFTRRDSSNNNVGWVVGGGLEYALTESVSAKVEYLHAQFDSKNGWYSSPDCPPLVFRANRDNSIDSVRLGLNWRFGAPAAPVAVSPVSARY